MAGILDVIMEVIALEKKLEGLVSQITGAINEEKDKKRRKAMRAAWEKRDADALRALMFPDEKS